MDIKLESNAIARTLAVVAGMAFIMISVAYGFSYIFEQGSIIFPVEPYYLFFIFAIGFVLFSVFFEREIGAVYPRELIGGAIASACFTFIITAAIAGMLYIWDKGLYGLGVDTVLYAFSISMILSLISYIVIKRMEIKIEYNDYARVLAIVAGIAFIIMISIVYGINYILKIDPFPLPPYLILLVFAVSFVITTVFYEKRGAIFPWSLLGGAIASACLVFIITAIIGGVRYIAEAGFTGLGADTVFYALSICIILGMILFDLFNVVKDKL